MSPSTPPDATMTDAITPGDTSTPVSTPAGKRKSSSTSLPKETPKKPKKVSPQAKFSDISSDPNFDPDLDLKLLDLSDDTVSTTPPKHLAQILAIRVKASDKLNHFQQLLKMSESQLRKRTIRVRDSLRKRPIKLITETTRDSIILSLSSEALRTTYKNIRKISSNPITDGELALYYHEELQKLIMEYRDSLKSISDEIEEELKEVSNSPYSSSSSNSKSNIETSKTTAPNTPKSDSEPPSSKPPPSSANAGSSASRTNLGNVHDPPTGQNLEELMNDASDENQPDADMKSVDMHTITIRPKIFGNRLEGDFPSLARQFFTQIQS